VWCGDFRGGGAGAMRGRVRLSGLVVGRTKPASVESLVLLFKKNGSHCCRMGAVQNSLGRHEEIVGVVVGGLEAVIDGELA